MPRGNRGKIGAGTNKFDSLLKGQMHLLVLVQNAESIAWNGRQPKSFEKDQTDQIPVGLEFMWLDQPNSIHNRLIPGAGVSPAALLPTFLDGEKSRPSETDTNRLNESTVSSRHSRCGLR